MPTINDRAGVAANSSTSETRLRELATDKSPKVREALARNPAVSTDVLEVLVGDTHWRVRYGVAKNPSVRARDIALTADDPDVRGLGAQRSDLDAECLRKVLADEVPSVRERLAEVTEDADTAAALARDPHPNVRATILVNPKLRDADVEMLASDAIAQVRGAAAHSRRLRPDTLTRLAEDRSTSVRWSVLVNYPERLDLARKLAQDDDEMNASQAQAQLRRPRAFTEFLGHIELIE